MISGTETKRARRPIHLNSRLKRNNWVRREKLCTQKSTFEKKRVRSSRVAKTLATKACCSRYKKVEPRRAGSRTPRNQADTESESLDGRPRAWGPRADC